ncbi:MAG: alpha/beta hydrolase [Tannerellaceae bacterium]
MKKYILMFGFISMSMFAMAQGRVVNLFPQGAPNETTVLVEGGSSQGATVGGQSVLRVENVSSPQIAIYPAKNKSEKNPVMLICPGGGYNILAYDLEGIEVAEWLNTLGFTAVLLKYRVPRREGRLKHEAALEDVQEAISYIRKNASMLHVDPDKLGVMGFSAGAHLSVMASNAWQAKGDSSSKPNYCLLVYPAYLNDEANALQLASEINVSTNTPPTMLVQTQDDTNFIDSSLAYYYALKQQNVPVEMHLYPKGGHGYGLRNTGAAVNEWPDRAASWFKEIGVLSAASQE